MDYPGRLKRVRDLLEEKEIDALFIDYPMDLYYLTGLELSMGKLLIDREEALLIVDGRYYEGAKDRASVPVKLLDKGWLKEYFHSRDGIRSLGLDGGRTSLESYHSLAESADVEGVELHVLMDPMVRLRAIKEEEEIACLKAAADLNSRGFDALQEWLQEGITEREIARKLEIFWLEEGGEGLSFEPIVAYGAASANPHYHPTDRQLKRGDCVLLDHGVRKMRYQSDMTRVLFFGGPIREVERIYQVVHEAFRAACGCLRDGVEVQEVDRAARDCIEAAGYGKYFTHGLGHGVGLEVHEWPVIKSTDPYGERVIEEGMVVTIEPGIYLPGKGGVRLEDTLVVTHEGSYSLTQRPMEPNQWP